MIAVVMSQNIEHDSETVAFMEISTWDFKNTVFVMLEVTVAHGTEASSDSLAVV